MEAKLAEAIALYDSNLVLKPKQEEALRHIMTFSSHKQDLIVNLPVGYGKSLIYHLMPTLLQEDHSPIVLVVSPLNVIQKDQLTVLSQHRITACRLDMEGTPDSESEYMGGCRSLGGKIDIQDVKDGKFSLVLAHPEALLNSSFGRDLLADKTFKSHVAGVVIDECHITDEWGKEFRTAYAKLHSLPCIFPDVPHVALSGSLTIEQINKLPGLLGMNKPLIIQECPDKPNIFLSIKDKIKCRESEAIYEDIFIDECDKLHENPSCYPVTLLFIPMFYMSKALCYLRYLFGSCDISSSPYSALFSRQDKNVFEITMKELKKDNPRIRLVLCTSAVGMGFDPASVTHIIHACPPRNVSKYLQEIGRAGRRGQSGYAVLYFNKSDIRCNLPGINQDIIDYCSESGCLRQNLLKVFGFSKSGTLKDCECCSNCRKRCDCDACLFTAFEEIMLANEQ